MFVNCIHVLKKVPGCNVGGKQEKGRKDDGPERIAGKGKGAEHSDQGDLGKLKDPFIQDCFGSGGDVQPVDQRNQRKIHPSQESYVGMSMDDIAEICTDGSDEEKAEKNPEECSNTEIKKCSSGMPP